MADTGSERVGSRRERIDQWSEHVDELCHDGETVERRVDLESATVAVTNYRVLAFAPDADGQDFRHVERPNVGTVSVETDDRLGQLCWGFAAAAVGVGLVEAARAVTLSAYAPTAAPQGVDSLPGGSARPVDAALSALETALLVLDWAVLLSGVAALVAAVALVARYVRSRSRRLVVRVSGGEDLVLPVSRADLEGGLIADLEAAIRPGETLEERSPAAEGDGDGRLPNDRAGDERERPDRRGAEWLGDEESG